MASPVEEIEHYLRSLRRRLISLQALPPYLYLLLSRLSLVVVSYITSQLLESVAMTTSPFMDGYSSEEYDDVDSSESQHLQEVASSALDSESDHEVWTAVVNGQALQEPAEEDVIEECVEELGAPSTIDTQQLPLLTAMESAWEETVPIHRRQDYETLVREGGSAAFIGITMVRNWVHRLLFRSAQYLQCYARAYMRFCRSVAASLRRSTSWIYQHEKEKDY